MDPRARWYVSGFFIMLYPAQNCHAAKHPRGSRSDHSRSMVYPVYTMGDSVQGAGVPCGDSFNP